MIPLIDQLARLLERTYDIDSGVVPVGRFVVGDEGHRRLTERRVVRQCVDEPGRAARLLLRRIDHGDGWAAALYLPDALVACLERNDPRRGLDLTNVDEFSTLVEEVDHLVTFAERSARGADVSLLELEWHAAVSKHLVLTHFAGRLTGRPRLDAAQRAFVDHHVFLKCTFTDPDPRVRDRYIEAHRLAWHFVRALDHKPAAERLSCLRRFHRTSARGKREFYTQ